MTQKLLALAVGLILLSYGFSACTNDQLPEPMVLAVCDTIQTSYTSNVKEIIDRSCATAVVISMLPSATISLMKVCWAGSRTA